ncbi:uncharacterized protein [Panulirus ornatus]|uniref:uncharacterized protein n=1 Tax=Panulirus ornatus TaxID=150431 RepID=UPI003A88264E
MIQMVARDGESSARAGDAAEVWWSGGPPPAPYIRSLLHAVGITALLLCAAVHFLLSLTAYVRQPVATYLSAVSEPLTFPSVTVCPALPFKLSVLSDRGLNNTNVRCSGSSSERSELAQLLQDMPGLWDEPVNLTSLWWSAGLQSSDYLPDTSLDDLPWNHWRPILTTNNVCYQLANTSQTKGFSTLAVVLSYKNIKEELLAFERDCYPQDYGRIFWVMLPEKGATPLAVSRSRFYKQKVQWRASNQLKITPMVVRRLPPCRTQPYRRSTCLQRCQLERAARRINCSLPYLPDTDLPMCHTQDQYRKSRKYILDEPSANETQPCEHLCGKDCESTYYYVDDVSTAHAYYREGFEAKLSWKNYFIIQEFWSTSFPRALSEVGGIVGLYLGWSVLGSGQGFANFLGTIEGHKWSRTRRRIRKLLLLTLYLLCAMTATLFWLHFAGEFAWNHPYYTRIETHRLRPRDLPAMTVCRWPPFNLSKLLEDGLIFNASAHCRNYGNRFSRCFRGTRVIQELPGMFGGRPLDQVWADAAWKLQDLVTHYTVDSNSFLVQ